MAPTTKEKQRVGLHKTIWCIANDANLSEPLTRVFKNIEGSAVGTNAEDDLRGLFDDLDVNNSKLGGNVAKRNENKLTETNQQHVLDIFTTREVIDITKLNAEIARIVARQQELGTSIDEIVADLEGTR